MKSSKLPWVNCSWSILAAAVALVFANPASAQPSFAYDDASNYVLSANWTNGANQGYGFTPWGIATSGPDFHGTYAVSFNKPAFAIATVSTPTGTNYNNVWGLFANGTNDVNTTVAFRGFTNSLGTNTFKVQWGSRGAGNTTTLNQGKVDGYCGFALRSGNVTNTTADLDTGTRLYFYFRNGNSPSTLYVWDNNGVQSLTGTSFSDLGRSDITNAVQVEVTPGADGSSYYLVVKDCVQGRTLFTTNSVMMGSGTVDSVALFCMETTGDQVYNRMQITTPRIPPAIVNVQPGNGSLYLDAASTSLAFEVDSFNSTVSSSAVSVYLNGVLQPGDNYSTTSPTTQLTATCTPVLAPNTFYTYTIIAQDANGNSTTNISTFNTFLASNLYIDASDYNYGAGLYFGGATPVNAFANQFGTNGIDYLETDLFGTNNLYRPGDLPQVISLNTDATGDPIDHANERASGYTVYNLGFTDVGEWQNYTRAIPSATNYSIYARAASGSGGQFEIEELQSSTATSSNQPLAALGRVNVPNTGGSRVYTGQLTPLTDVFGNTVVVPLAGTKTFRCTALQSRTYNLEYLVLVPVTNATSLLRPYAAAASPLPNATGVVVTTPISLTLAHRQTTVNTNTIKLYTNSVQVTAGLTLSSNAVGAVVTYTPGAFLSPNATNTVMVTCIDSAGANLTNTWSFVTSGTPGNGLWSGAGSDLNWSTSANWTGGFPSPGTTATFASAGAATSLAINNIVSANLTIAGLFYNTNNSGYHTTYIADGVTLTVTNGATTVTPILQVGGYYNSDNTFNKKVTNTITGVNGTLIVAGNPQGGLGNQLNFQVRQCANPAAPEQTVLDMSGLGTLNATVGKFYVAQGGGGANQNNVSGRVNLARTNVITLLRGNSGQFEVGDSSGGNGTLPGSTLNLGITNAFFLDSARFGKQKATNNLVRFNPDFLSLNPVAFFRSTNGLNSRVSLWTIGDADTETANLPVFSSANLDFSGGKFDAMIGTLIMGRSGTAAADTGFAQGVLTTTAGTLDVTNVQLGVQRAVSTATASGILNILGTSTLVCSNVTLAQPYAGGNASLVSGTLNVTNGTARVSIAAGGGVTTVNVKDGTLVVTGTAGTPTAPLSALNLSGAALHLNVDGNAAAATVNASAVTATGTRITVDSVANVTGLRTIHLLGYSGANPFAGLSLAPLPSGYTGTLVNNSGSVDLQINVVPPPSPTIGKCFVDGGQFILRGTNNNSGVGGGTFHVLASTNLSLPLSNWSVLTSGSFDASGNFAVTNSMTNSQRFYMLQVP